MRYTKDDLAGKSIDELLAIANLEFNLGLDRRYKHASIVYHIVEASKKMGSNDVAALHTADDVKQAKDSLPEGFAIVRLHKSQRNPSGHHEYVGFQGNGALIPVGIEVRIPEYLLEILDNAYTHEWRENPATKEFEEQVVHNKPFTVLRHNPSAKWAEHMKRAPANARKMEEFTVFN